MDHLSLKFDPFFVIFFLFWGFVVVLRYLPLCDVTGDKYQSRESEGTDSCK